MDVATPASLYELRHSPFAAAGPRRLLEVPAGYGGHGARLDASAAPSLGRLLARCDHEVAITLGGRGALDADRILRIGAPGTRDAAPDGRFRAGLFDGDGEMAAFVEVLRDYPARSVWCIAMLVVRRELRGCGIGSSMVEAIEAWARGEGADVLHLRLPRRDAGAIAFGRRSGFALAGDVPRSADSGLRFAAMARSLR